MRSLHIKRKLLVSFIVVAAVVVFFGMWALSLFSSVNDMFLDSCARGRGMLVIHRMLGAVGDVKDADLKYAFARNDADRSSLVAVRRERGEAASSAMSAYRDGFKDDVIEIGAVIDAWNTYKSKSDSFIALWNDNKVRDAAATVNGEMATAYGALVEAIDRLAVKCEGHAVSDEAIGEKYYWRALVLVVIAIVFIMIVAFAVSFPLDKSIKKAIISMLEEAERTGNMEDIPFTPGGAMVNDLVAHMQSEASILAHSSEELERSAERSEHGTRQIDRSIEHVSKASKKQYTDLEHVVEELARMSSEISRLVEEVEDSSRSALSAVEKAREGEGAMQRVVTQMELIEKTASTSSKVVTSLGERSNEIGQIVGTISRIASQTNLLALNAAIEAARAGDQGKGFTVVANEVKKLAGESQLAAEEIAKLIDSIQAETDQAIEAMENGQNEVRSGAEAIEESGRSFSDLAAMSVENSTQLKDIVETMRGLGHTSEALLDALRSVEGESKAISDDSQSIVEATEAQASSMEEISRESKELEKISQDMIAEANRLMKQRKYGK